MIFWSKTFRHSPLSWLELPWGGKLDSRFARLLTKYNTLGPELLKLLPKETTSGLSLVDSLGALDNFGTTVDAYKDIDFSLLKTAGYTELTDALEIAGHLAVVAGEIGLEALKVLWKYLNDSSHWILKLIFSHGVTTFSDIYISKNYKIVTISRSLSKKYKILQIG